MTTHVHVVSRLGMSGAVLLHPHVTLWHAQAQIYITYCFLLKTVITVEPLYMSSSGDQTV